MKEASNIQTSHHDNEVTLRTIGSVSEIDAEVWNALNDQSSGGCLSSHQMLTAFEESASVCPETGWQPHHLLLEVDAVPIAALVMYAKGHSQGEFVFDWAWADAYARHGIRYYPKWLSAVPFTPVAGTRFLCDEKFKPLAAQALLEWVKASPLSSLHVLYTTDTEQQALIEAGCLPRKHTQFHWMNQGWPNFEAFLESLSKSKRKKIRAERRKVQEAGLHTKVLVGQEISAQDWDFFYLCYANTYAMRGNPPYLTRDFFDRVAKNLAQNCFMVIAYQGDRRIASAFSWLDSKDGKRQLYGRYWGCVEHIDCLHFEVAYYSAIEWAIENGIDIIEGGAQGQHKMARGFVPVHTYSAHWLAHPGFFDAIDNYLKQETEQIEQYTAALDSPFKHSS